jgi:hypothetical protein
MANVAGAHHALIVTEFNSLIAAQGANIVYDRPEMVQYDRDYLMHRYVTDGVIMMIQAIKHTRDKYHGSLRDTKHIVDDAIEELRHEGHLPKL